MHNIRHTIAVLLFCCIGCVFATAQETKVEHQSDTLEVYFRQGYSLWEPNFKNNGKRLEAFVERFRKLHEDTVFKSISKIHIVSGASPEGTWRLNQRLSKNRANRIRSVLKRYISLPDTVIVEDSRGIDWQGLYELVEASDMQYRDEVLDIIKNTPELANTHRKNPTEVRKRKLVWLHGSRPWNYMYKHFFPKLRSFQLQIVIEWEKYIPPVPPAPEKVEIIPEPEPEPVPEPAPEPVVIPEPKPFYMAVRTNMLYDAALVPNIGVEFYLGKKWTIGANWMYAWWKSDPDSWYHRTYGGDLEVRRYFGKASDIKPLQGFHAGLYGQIVTYDFEMGGRGYLGDRWTWGGGLSLGYSLPIKKRLNIDFNLGVGYLGGEYKEYLPIDDCYVWQATKQRHWFGPTKLEVSLVWLLGRGNVNKSKMKGGEK